MRKPEYTFGTSATAASRLEEIAKYFNPLATDLIQLVIDMSAFPMWLAA